MGWVLRISQDARGRLGGCAVASEGEWLLQASGGMTLTPTAHMAW